MPASVFNLSEKQQGEYEFFINPTSMMFIDLVGCIHQWMYSMGNNRLAIAWGKVGILDP
jgi:hypothetical protein